MISKLKLRQFSIAFKVRIIRYYESLQDDRHIRLKSLGFVSNKTGILRQCLRNWIKNKEVLLNQKDKFKRSKIFGGTHRCQCEFMEMLVVDWLKDERAKGVCVSSRSLTIKAVQVHE